MFYIQLFFGNNFFKLISTNVYHLWSHWVNEHKLVLLCVSTQLCVNQLLLEFAVVYELFGNDLSIKIVVQWMQRKTKIQFNIRFNVHSKDSHVFQPFFKRHWTVGLWKPVLFIWCNKIVLRQENHFSVLWSDIRDFMWSKTKFKVKFLLIEKWLLV